MSSPVLYTHSIVEGSANPFAIPPRPPVSQDVEFTELAGREYTYRVTVGTTVIGFIRWDANDFWIARTTGSAAHAASIRRFNNKQAAVAWLRNPPRGGRR